MVLDAVARLYQIDSLGPCQGRKASTVVLLRVTLMLPYIQDIPVFAPDVQGIAL